MNNKQTVSKRAAGVLSPGLQGFLWYLAETAEEGTQEFRLEPGVRMQHIVHLQNPTLPCREYDITVAQSENLVSADLIVRRHGSCGAMLLKEEVENHG